MTPEAIRILSQLRQEFYTLFSVALDVPADITKGNSHSTNPSKASWRDDSHRLNYVCIYSHSAPDELFPDRPLILRVGVNKGLGIGFMKREPEPQVRGRRLLQFELTLLPAEVLDFAPWLVQVLQTNEDDHLDRLPPPPYGLNIDTLDELLRHGAWTRSASVHADAVVGSLLPEGAAPPPSEGERSLVGLATPTSNEPSAWQNNHRSGQLWG